MPSFHGIKDGDLGIISPLIRVRDAGREDTVIKEIEKHFVEGEVEKTIQGLFKMDFKLNNFSLAPYTIWLIGFCQAGRVEEALKIFPVLKESKVIVSLPICVRLIVGLCKQGKLDLAVDVFLYTLEKGFKLMPRVCNYLLKSFFRSKGKKMHAFDLLSKTNSQRYDLDAYLDETTKSLLYRHRHT